MDPNGIKKERRPGGGQLQDLEPVLQGMEEHTLPHSRWRGSVQERWREIITKTKSHHTTAALSNGNSVQIARSDWTSRVRQSATKYTAPI